MTAKLCATKPMTKPKPNPCPLSPQPPAFLVGLAVSFLSRRQSHFGANFCLLWGVFSGRDLGLFGDVGVQKKTKGVLLSHSIPLTLFAIKSVPPEGVLQ
jgi:hypothetical protein